MRKRKTDEPQAPSGADAGNPARRQLLKRRQNRRGRIAAWARYFVGLPQPPLGAEPAPRPFDEHVLDHDFFGMNVCPSADPAGDAVQIAALRALGATTLRLDFGPHAPHAVTHRFIHALLQAEGFSLVLRLIQPPDQAASMDLPDRRKAWRSFLDAVLERYGSDIEAIEVGGPPNRTDWSGYAPRDYAAASRIAREAIDHWVEAAPRTAQPLLLGPDAHDFAPWAKIALLAACRQEGVRFDAATDSLLDCGGGQPEIARTMPGLLALGRLRLNATGRQRLLQKIAARFGAPNFWDVGGQYALELDGDNPLGLSTDQYMNYMVRRHVLAAAAGFIQRQFWGPLVGHHHGLIDEPVSAGVDPDSQPHRFCIDSPPSTWKRRERFFDAYATMTKQLARMQFVRRWKTQRHVYVYEFKAPRGRSVVAWTRDGRQASQNTTLRGHSQLPTRILNREGRSITPEPRIVLGPAPVYWVYG